MGTLYECLREARLEKYYPSFRAQGITKSEALTRLTASDCPAFGINSTEDKKRLLELISIVKAVHNTERGSYLSVGAVNKSSQNVKNKMPRKRNRSPAHTPLQTAGRSLAVSNDVRVRDRSRTNASSHQLSAAGAALLDLLSDEESTATSSSESEEHSDYEPAVKHSVTASASREVPSKIRKTPVEKIKYGAGYNYGVPGGSATGTKAKSRGNSRLGEDKIKVCVRKRPLSKKETRTGEEDMIRTPSTTTLVVSEPKQAVDLTAYTLQHEFIFDEVFEESCTNEDVYIRAARPLINCIFDGGSATCFAYGQTGAGKTHTMIGSREIPGLYLLAAHDIFSIIECGQYGAGIHVWVSFFEIYCGQLFDLLNKRNRLHAREDGSHRVCIAGLTETEARDEQSLMQVLEYGNSVRSKGATGVNPDSSRSHAVLQMEIRDRHDKRLGRISFIDLAGSERASDSADTDRQTRMEGAEINQSLLALKECIRSIDQESRHKPFRQSKLTHILKDSFIGNSRTCMIANISPASSSCEHTLNTLRYADRVKELRRNATSASTSKSMNVAMSNILMNIPASAPSLFQPSNILCSSTPMRQSTRQFTNRNSNAELQLDPSETPIRGPGATRRKTSSAASRSDSRSRSHSQSHRGVSSASTPSRAPAVRHIAAPNISNVGSRQNLSSNSESDQTDTDSCNVTGPQKPVVPSHQMHNIEFKTVNIQSNVVKNSGRVGASSQNIPVVKSTDTENDFPTTDFNNEEEVKKKGSSDLELNDLNRTGGKNNVVTASVPVFRSVAGNQVETQCRNENDGIRGGQSSQPLAHISAVSASVPVLRKKMYMDSQNQQNSEDLPNENQRRSNASNTSEVNIQITTHSNAATPTANIKSSGVRHSPVPSKTMNLEKPTTNRDRGSPLQIALGVTESFDDDMLFDPPSIDQRLWTPRTPSENSGTQPRIPQDPSLQPEIPAVLPAKSTELTTFSQRSPRWQLNKNQNNFQAPVQQHVGFRPEPVQNIPSATTSKTGNTAANRIPNSAGYAKMEPKPSTNEISASVRNRPSSSHLIPKQKDNFFSQVNINNDVQNVPSSYNENSFENRNKRAASNNIGNKQSSGNISNMPELVDNSAAPKEPLSANWFSTPADHETHVAISSSRKRTSSGDQSDRESLKSKSDKNSRQHNDFDDTELKDFDDEYLPIQRKVDKNKSSHSDSGVVSAVSDCTSASDIKTNNNPSKQANRVGENASSYYQKSNFSQPGYFSDSGIKSKTSATVQTSVKQRVVHSPVMTRQAFNSSPVIKDFQSYSSVNDRAYNSNSPLDNRGDNSNYSSNGNSALKTEKLKAGAMFSPIHPQPVTTSRTMKTSVAVSKDILHPTPVSKNTSTDGGSGSDGRRGSSNADSSEESDVIDLKSQLITSHEDQLATVTSFCKQEMKLLLGAKAGNKTFEEYMDKVSDILSQKMSTIQLLQDQIIAYQLSTQDG